MKFYYDTCESIDRHNKQRQDDLELEKNTEHKILVEAGVSIYI